MVLNVRAIFLDFYSTLCFSLNDRVLNLNAFRGVFCILNLEKQGYLNNNYQLVATFKTAKFFNRINYKEIVYV